MSRILLFGKNGQVGWELHRSLQALGEVVALGSQDADFAQPQSLRAIVAAHSPTMIVNAAAYTAVDRAESEEALAHRINAQAPGVLAEECAKLGARLVHYSTDYVFDGTKSAPYTEADTPAPQNAYGRTKLAGERMIAAAGCDHFIFRTSWVYASRGKNFLRTILRLHAEGKPLRIIADQFGAPTSARLIADVTAQCLAQQARADSGIYHLTAQGRTSWHGFATAIVQCAASMQGVASAELPAPAPTPIPTSDYPLPAARPANSSLDCLHLEQTFGVSLPDWQSGLALCLAECLEGGLERK